MPPRKARLIHRTLALLFVGMLLAASQVRAEAQSSTSDPQADSANAGTTQGDGQHRRRPGPPSPAMELDRLTKAMKSADAPLTDAQKVAILGVLEDRETAQQAVQSSTSNPSGTMDRTAAMQETQALEKATRSAIAAVLTEAQQKVYATLRQGRPTPPSGAPPRNNNGAPAPPPDGSSDQAESGTDANTGGGVQQANQ